MHISETHTMCTSIKRPHTSPVAPDTTAHPARDVVAYRPQATSVGQRVRHAHWARHQLELRAVLLMSILLTTLRRRLQAESCLVELEMPRSWSWPDNPGDVAGYLGVVIPET